MIPTIIAPIIIDAIPGYDTPSTSFSGSKIGTVGRLVCSSTAIKLVLYPSGLSASSDEANILIVFPPTSRREVSSSVSMISTKLLLADLIPDTTVSPLELETK